LSKKVAFRLNGLYEGTNSFRKHVNLNREGINPTFLFAPDSKTSISIGYEYFRDHRVADRGITSFQGHPANVPIDTIAFGTSSGTVTIQGESVPVPADPATMKAIASGSGGKSFTATSGSELKAVYSQIRKVVGFDSVKTDLTEWFTGLGLLLALLTAGAALWWMQRIP